MAVDTRKVEVVRLKIEPHPNADRLDVARIFDFTCCVPKGQFRDGDLAAYVQPDSVVDSSRPEFFFLAGHERIRVKRMRGVVSMGLLLEAPAGAKEGDDLAEYFGVVHYDPPIPEGLSDVVERGPIIWTPEYDIESMYRHRSLFVEGEPCMATEKLNGVNSRFVFASAEDRMYCGSRNLWHQQLEGSLLWKALAKHPWLEEFCRAHPDHVVYGETFGNSRKMKYGAKSGDVFFRAFDVLKGAEWLNVGDIVGHAMNADQWAPIVYEGPFNFEKLKELSEGPSLIPGANHMREGIVVRPVPERADPYIGRVHLKLVSNRFLEKDE